MLSHTAAHNAYDARMAHIESSEESQQMIRRYPLRNIDDIVRETGVENKMRLARYAFAMDNSGSLPSDDERRAASLFFTDKPDSDWETIYDNGLKYERYMHYLTAAINPDRSLLDVATQELDAHRNLVISLEQRGLMVLDATRREIAFIEEWLREAGMPDEGSTT